MMFVLGIDPDTKKEAQYLHDLAQEFHITKDQVNVIHDNLGVARIYRRMNTSATSFMGAVRTT